MSSGMCRYSRYHSSDTCRIHHHNHATSNVVTIYASMLSTHPTLSSNHSTPCTHRHRTSLFTYHTITLNPSTPRCIRLIPHQRHPIPTLPVNTSTITKRLQQRMHQNIYNACKRFLHVSHQDSAQDQSSDDNSPNNTQHTSVSDHVYSHGIVHELHDSLESNTRTSAPELDLAYTCKASALPIMATMVSLPSQLNIQPMLSLLNPEDAALYRHPSNNILLTTTEYNQLIEQLRHDSKLPPKPKLLANQQEYTHLIKRIYEVGMVTFTTTPKCINGLLAVPKPDGSQRIIIDAQPCNLYFHEPPYVTLPSPTHLSRVRVQNASALHLAKLDLSNCYHHIGLQEWMQPYFALPPLRVQNISQTMLLQHGDIEMHPMCTTLPMGFSHSVYIAQQIHNQCLYKNNTLHPANNIINIKTPYITNAIHMLYIDDNCIIGTDAHEVTHQYHACIQAYRDSGLLIKPDKCTATTSAPTEMLGIVIDGQQMTMHLHATKMLKLLGQTLYLIHKRQCTGTTLSRLMGHWTWALMLRRPMFAIVRHCYLYRDVYKGRSHTLWPSVIKELHQLVALAPLLYAHLATPLLNILPASDASMQANGVVLSYTTSQTIDALYHLSTYNTKQYVTNENRY